MLFCITKKLKTILGGCQHSHNNQATQIKLWASSLFFFLVLKFIFLKIKTYYWMLMNKINYVKKHYSKCVLYELKIYKIIILSSIVSFYLDLFYISIKKMYKLTHKILQLNFQ